jgi:hypothetical protein
MDCAISFGEQIVQLDIGIGGDPRQAIANSARGGVVTLAIASGKNEDFFHKGLSERASGRKRTEV